MSEKKSKPKVFVGLSGGVDSAVCAALLQKQGYEVTGLFAFIALPGYPCTAGEDRREALRVAAHLRIPFEELDLSLAYQKKVFAAALSAYARGETPNPDALCNREIKFGLLYDYAMEKGADLFATGHYARLHKGRAFMELLAGKDPKKDQSYFLWAVPEEKLARTLFPVGELPKTEVRKLAKKFKLPNALRPDSQGLCFIGEISLDDVLTKELRPIPGDVLDAKGTVIGSHRGALLYTVGQRHGFEIRARSTSAVPQYVVAKDIVQNTITVSPQPGYADMPRQSEESALRLREENWIGDIEPGPCKARFRYRQTLMPANVEIAKKGARIVLAQPQAMPLGQSLVLYRKERCLGGGIIDSVE